MALFNDKIKIKEGIPLSRINLYNSIKKRLTVEQHEEIQKYVQNQINNCQGVYSPSWGNTIWEMPAFTKVKECAQLTFGDGEAWGEFWLYLFVYNYMQEDAVDWELLNGGKRVLDYQYNKI
ncbi:MAG: hypothetical protein KH031_24135 [Clostridiales bacterium]|nr:hypothetical protein [Clostridiales bacterium]